MAAGADASDPDQMQAAIDRIPAELSPPTVLVDNAGVTRGALLFTMTEDRWCTCARAARS